MAVDYRCSARFDYAASLKLKFQKFFYMEPCLYIPPVDFVRNYDRIASQSSFRTSGKENRNL